MCEPGQPMEFGEVVLRRTSPCGALTHTRPTHKVER